jgi:hypothetical protein
VTDRVVRERCCDSSSQSKAPAKAAGYIIFATALPNGEMACGMNAAFSRVQAQHNFAEAHQIPAAGFDGFEFEIAHALRSRIMITRIHIQSESI